MHNDNAGQIRSSGPHGFNLVNINGFWHIVDSENPVVDNNQFLGFFICKIALLKGDYSSGISILDNRQTRIYHLKRNLGFT